MIEVTNVQKTFAEKKVLDNINATFYDGKINLLTNLHYPEQERLK